MRIPTLLAVLAFVLTGFMLPAAADSTVDRTPTAAPPEAISPEACLAKAKGNHLAQVNKDGYEPASLSIDRTWSWWVVGDIFGCLIIFSPFCIMHDIDQGGYYTFDDKIYLTLDRRTASEPPAPK
jgi:hypothetical protein